MSFLLYEEMEEPILEEPVSPAPASQIHEPTMPRIEEMGFQAPERLGWTRTVLLALGAGLGVMGTAGVIHLVKKGKGAIVGPKGWTRTAILSGGAAAGTLLTAGLIHVARGGQGALKKYSMVEEI